MIAMSVFQEPSIKGSTWQYSVGVANIVHRVVL